MTQEKFDRLIQEIDTIARKVALFPKELQPTVFELIVATLLDEPSETIVNRNRDARNQFIHGVFPSGDTSVEARNYATELEEYYREYALAEINDMQLAAFTAYYFTVLAPPELKVDAITGDHYEDLCIITGRKLPNSSKKTLINAKNSGRYLERKGTGMYSLTARGQHYVKNTLLKKAELEVQHG